MLFFKSCVHAHQSRIYFYFSVPHLSVGISTLVFLVYEMFCHLNYMDVTVLTDKLAVDTSVIVFLTCDYSGMLNPQNSI